jgi:alkylated DNA nucleotide flippase Atl1
MDNMIGEEYIPLRMPNYEGAFVGSVRAAYEELLLGIADACCTEVSFVSDQSNRIAALIFDRYSVEPDFPWDEGEKNPSGVFRHAGNNKWFGLIMNIDRRHLDKSADSETVDVINLKADENKTAALHKIRGVYPAYHMNHSKWISVVLDDTLDDRDVMDLVDESFDLTNNAAGVLNEKLIREALSIADSIPPGKVMSYGQIAEMMGRPKNARLVGKIMSMQDRYGNHPCHRVVNSAGRTVPGWTEQRELLEAEGVEFRENGNVDMRRFRMD